MTEEQHNSESQDKDKSVFNLDKKFLILVGLIVIYAVSKSFTDNNNINACNSELEDLYSGSDWQLDSFCLCQNDFLNKNNDWFVKEKIRKEGFLDFFMTKDTTGAKEEVLSCLKSNINDHKVKPLNFQGEFKDLMIKKCIKLIEDDDFRNKHDLELYCSCFMNKNKSRLTINTVFESDFFFLDNFRPLDTICLQMSYR